MNLSLFLFLIGVLGFILNRKNIILMIIAIEIMLLAVINANHFFLSESIFNLLGFHNSINIFNVSFSNSNLNYELNGFFSTQMLIQPWQITGITDGDGNFSP